MRVLACIIGCAGVGKSCILMQFLENKFKIDSETTVGVQFGSKFIDLGTQTPQSAPKKIKLQIWDTAGQQIFKSITRSYYRGSIGAVLVYDITCRQSFSNVTKWMQQTKNYANEKLSIILVGNKIDLQSKRVVSTREGREFAEKNNLLFMECSARNSTEEIFVKLAKQIVNKIENGVIDPRNESLGVKVGNYKKQALILEERKKQTCC